MADGAPDWREFQERFAAGEWRAPIFRDMIAADASELARERPALTILDIGCGGGFDGDSGLQASLARLATTFVGVEPATDVEPGLPFTTVHRCLFEEAPIQPGSVDLAFAVMVLEHLDRPERFWGKLHEVLRPGGVFWGFTVDARHWFVPVSMLAERLRIKDRYLDLLHGKRGVERYENYGVHYRANTPTQVHTLGTGFRSTTALNFSKVGQADYYVPRGFRWLARAVDHVTIKAGLPGCILAVRVVR